MNFVVQFEATTDTHMIILNVLLYSKQFFCFLLLVLVAEIATGAWAFHNREKLESMVRASVKNTIQHEYGHIESKTEAFDTFQAHVSILRMI